MEGIDHRPDSTPSNPNRPQGTFHPTDRINELNEIDKSIAQLLQAAGEAIQTLGSNSSSASLPAAKSQFLESVTTYFTTLSSIDVRLRRQVYALQEAGLIAEGDAKDAKRGASAAGAGVVTGGAHLGPSWMQSSGAQTEQDMEMEIWTRAWEFIERLDGKAGGRVAGDGEKEKEEDLDKGTTNGEEDEEQSAKIESDNR